MTYIRGSRVNTIIGLMVVHKYKVMAEVGVFKSSMVKKFHRLDTYNIVDEYWAIDTWKVIPRFSKDGDQNYAHSSSYGRITAEGWDRLYKRACLLMMFYPPLRVLKMESTEAAKLFEQGNKYIKKDGYFDLVFIDADHRKQEVLKDIEVWLPLIRKGGIICGHDYPNWKYPGVKEAVDEYFGEENIELHPGCVWVKRL